MIDNITSGTDHELDIIWTVLAICPKTEMDHAHHYCGQ